MANLIGTWAVDCTKASDKQNVYLKYTARGDGTLDYVIIVGAEQMERRVLYARRLDGALLELTSFGRVRDAGGHTDNIYTQAVSLDAGKLRVMWSFQLGERGFRVANGHEILPDKPSLTLTFCPP
jgi:hypothetical protein